MGNDMGNDERTPSDTSGIDMADVQQDSPAQAESEVTDPDGNDRDDQGIGEGVLTVAPIGQTGVVAGGTSTTGQQ
jgi:hypothetical protein